MAKAMAIITIAFTSASALAEVFYPLKSRHLDGCGLIASKNQIAYAETGNENFLWVRLGADDERALLVSTRGNFSKIGETKTNVYRLKNRARIELRMKLVGYCGAVSNKNEDCELFDLDVSLKSGNKEQNLTAEYGC